MSPFTPRPVEILLVGDNPGDARLTAEALAESRARNRLHQARGWGRGPSLLTVL